MLIPALLAAALLIVGFAFAFQQYRSGQIDSGAEIIFETRINPPFLRPVVTRLSNGDLHIDAPVVHARLMSDILVLDVKSNSGARAEGFEVAITNFDANWLRDKGYQHFESAGHLLVGPQGEMTDRLLRRAGREHSLDLPTESGSHVQVFEIEAIITDPSDSCIRVEAVLPSGETFSLSYDYASASVRAQVSAAALTVAGNYQPLGVRMAA